MLSVWFIENNKIDGYLGQVKLNKGKIGHVGLGKGFG